jgi:hypothetical protein
MSLYSKKKKIEDPLARNMFIRSNMDYCIAEVTSEGANMYRMFNIEYSLAKNMCSRLNMDYCMAEGTSERVHENI